MRTSRNTILIADDDADDVFFLLEALRKAGIENPTQIVKDGAETIDYLAGRGPYANREKYPFPALLLLDLKMPGPNGFDVLKRCQESGISPGLRIIVFSGSDLPEDIEKAKSLGAAAYRVKRAGAPSLLKLARELRDYWLAEHPQNSEPAPQLEFFQTFT